MIVLWPLPVVPGPWPQAMVEETRRLVGHEVAPLAAGAGYVIEDVAGEGRPLVGVVERRGEELWLLPVDADFGAPAVRLAGKLATPRIAGPGYKVWVLGAPEPDGSLRVRRLGVLRPPER